MGNPRGAQNLLLKTNPVLLMYKNILFIESLSAAIILFMNKTCAQVYNPLLFNPSPIIDTSGFDTYKMSGYAPYGGVFTPKGVVRALIIYAGFTNDNGQYVDNWPANSPTPNYVDAQTGLAEELILGSQQRVIELRNSLNRSVSCFYDDKSLGKFTIIGDVLKDPATGLPVRINIDPTEAPAITSWASTNSPNKRVILKMQEMYPNFDWSPYDNRTNGPNYQYDNSNSQHAINPIMLLLFIDLPRAGV